MEPDGKLLEALLDCAEGVYIVEEDSRRIVYANRRLTESRGGRLEGEPCYRALMGRDAPCPHCPALGEEDAAPYPWDWFDTRSGKWMKIKNRLVTVGGVRYRVGNLNEVADMMDLSREAVTEMGALNRVIRQYNQTKSELEYESTHDRMTRLYNRNQYIRDLRLAEDIRSAGVLFFDLNNLKEVNDRYRHAAGDMLLRRLAACLGPADGRGRRAYRIGGDEFVVLCKNGTRAELDACLDGILAELERRNRGEALCCAAAVGAAWSDEVIDLEELVREADRRMYEDKRRRKQAPGQGAAVRGRRAGNLKDQEMKRMDEPIKREPEATGRPLDDEALEQAAGGVFFSYCPGCGARLSDGDMRMRRCRTCGREF